MDELIDTDESSDWIIQICIETFLSGIEFKGVDSIWNV